MLVATAVALAAVLAGSKAGDAATLPTAPVVITVQVGDSAGERYRINVTDPLNVDIARRLYSGEITSPNIPNGLVHSGTEVNTGYRWHIDPDSLEFADAAIDDCDGVPSAVGPSHMSRFCPWAARVVAIDNGRPPSWRYLPPLRRNLN